MNKNRKMIEKKSWKEFRATGLLWLINTILHSFGWAIVLEVDDENNTYNAYPARVRFRGFSKESNDRGYLNLAKYMKDNSEELLEEMEEEIELEKKTNSENSNQ